MSSGRARTDSGSRRRPEPVPEHEAPAHPEEARRQREATRRLGAVRATESRQRDRQQHEQRRVREEARARARRANRRAPPSEPPSSGVCAVIGDDPRSPLRVLPAEVDRGHGGARQRDRRPARHRSKSGLRSIAAACSEVAGERGVRHCRRHPHDHHRRRRARFRGEPRRRPPCRHACSAIQAAQDRHRLRGMREEIDRVPRRHSSRPRAARWPTSAARRVAPSRARTRRTSRPARPTRSAHRRSRRRSRDPPRIE